MGKKRHHAHVGRSQPRPDEEEEQEVQVEAAVERAESTPSHQEAPIASPPSRGSDDGERRASGETPEEGPSVVGKELLKNEIAPASEDASTNSGDQIQGSSGVSTIEEAPLVPSGEASPLPPIPADTTPPQPEVAQPENPESVHPADSEAEEEEALQESQGKPQQEEPSALAEIVQVLTFRIAVAFLALALRAAQYIYTRPVVGKATTYVLEHKAFPPAREAAVNYTTLAIHKAQPWVQQAEVRLQPVFQLAERRAGKQIASVKQFAVEVLDEALRMARQFSDKDAQAQ